MNQEPSWRKPAGIFIILALIVVWAFVIVSLFEWIADWPFLIQMLLYVIAGTIWILPLKPLLRWMELGRWRS